MHPDASEGTAAVPPSIRTLTDQELIACVDDLVLRERLTTLEVLFHLAEIDRRGLWRELEYRSMFDYCIRRLRYSEGATARRLRVARLIARHPHVHDRIREGRLSLCAVSKIARTPRARCARASASCVWSVALDRRSLRLHRCWRRP